MLRESLRRHLPLTSRIQAILVVDSSANKCSRELPEGESESYSAGSPTPTVYVPATRSVYPRLTKDFAIVPYKRHLTH